MSEPRRDTDAGRGELVDDLTGALTRGLFGIRIGAEIERARRSGSSCSVCLVDIDQLKSVNDAFGHARGDTVLRQVVERINRQLRGADGVYRYGGDEFVLLLPDTGKAEAAEVARRVVDAVGREAFAGAPALRLSISLGIASFPADAADPVVLMAAADARTYLAKRRGRGRVAIDDEAGEAPPVIPRLIERDAPMAVAQRFLSGLVDGQPGALRVGGRRGAGYTRFLAEVANIAALRGLDVVRLAGIATPASSPDPTPATGSAGDSTARPPGRSSGNHLLVIADGEAAWARATQVALDRVAEGMPAVGLVLAGPGRPAGSGAGPIPLHAAVELTAWSADAMRVWLRTRLQGEPSVALIEHLCAASEGLPARAERVLSRLVDGHSLTSLPDGWTLAAPAPSGVPGQRLPVPPTELIGRGGEIDHLIGLLGTERLVTLTGPGGIGKTRLALAVAAAVADRYADGTVFVPLAEATVPGHVEVSVAQAMQITEVTDEPLMSTIAAHLRERQLLLILDNFEQVRPAVDQVAAWLAAAPRLTVLVTSRERLRGPGECVYPVLGLTLPDRPAGPAAAGPAAVALALTQSSALELFTARAQRVAYDFALTGDNLPAAVELCHRLDGLPLAIELAAARTDTMTPGQLLARLTDRLDVLGDGPVDTPTRQQTLRAAIDWSYDLLDDAHRALFRALGVFSGGCRAEAIAAVESAHRLTERLTELIEKSLLRVDPDPDGEDRFIMLETIRTYAREQLAGRTAGELANRHAAYYATFADQVVVELFGPQQSAAIDRIAREQHNVRTALARALEVGDIETAARITAGIWRFWATRGNAGEGRQWIARVLEARDRLRPGLLASLLYAAAAMAIDQGDVPTARSFIEQSLSCAAEGDEAPRRAELLRTLGRICAIAGDYEQAQVAYEDSLAVARAESNPGRIAGALNGLGEIAIKLSNFDDARELMTESLALLRLTGRTLGILSCLGSLGEILMFQGDVAHARPLLEESLALTRELGDVGSESFALHQLGIAAELNGDRPEAARLLLAGLSLRHEIQERQGIADSLEAVAHLTVEADPALTASLLGSAEGLRDRHQLPRPPVWQHQWDALVQRLDEIMKGPAREAAWTAGQTSTVEEIVAAALAFTQTAPLRADLRRGSPVLTTPLRPRRL